MERKDRKEYERVSKVLTPSNEKQLEYILTKKDRKVLVISDLHLSDKESERHINYLQHCIDFCESISQLIIKEKPDAVILLGDIVGRHREKNFETREGLSLFTRIFMTWSHLVNGMLFSVWGNHDVSGSITDADYFTQIGVINRFDELDFGDFVIHCLDYGENKREINVDTSKYNVALGHDEYIIEGHTDWFFVSKKAVSLRSLTNLKGVDLLLSGHIHKPSKKVNKTTIDNEEIELFYLGCALEPSFDETMPDTTYNVIIESNEGVVKYRKLPIQLKPKDEVFRTMLTEKEIQSAILMETEDLEGKQAKLTVDGLTNVLSQIKDMSLFDDTTVETQIRLLGSSNPRAVELALKTMSEVEGEY